jgi:hypothetical protein
LIHENNIAFLPPSFGQLGLLETLKADALVIDAKESEDAMRVFEENNVTVDRCGAAEV